MMFALASPHHLPHHLTVKADISGFSGLCFQRVINSLAVDGLPPEQKVAGSSPAGRTTYRHPPHHYHTTFKKWGAG